MRCFNIQINADFPIRPQIISFTQEALRYYLNYCTAHPFENVIKVDLPKKCLRWRAKTLFGNEGETSSVLCKILFLGDLLENQYLLPIIHTSITIKNGGNMVKSGCFEKPL